MNGQYSLFVFFAVLCYAAMSYYHLKRLLSPMWDPFCQEESKSECVEDGHLHLAQLSEFVNDSTLQTTIISKKIFTWNPIDTSTNQQQFYQEWFDMMTVNKLGNVNCGIQCYWNAFLFQLRGVPVVDKFIIIQQWLDNRNRKQIWDDYDGQFYQFKCFTDMLHCIGSKHSWVVFVHFRLCFRQNVTLNSVIFGTLGTIMNDEDLILCLHCTPRNYTKYQPYRYMEMNFILNKRLQLSAYHKACVGTIVKWCNNIIPKCFYWINHHFVMNFSCKFPFNCAEKKETVGVKYMCHALVECLLCCLLFCPDECIIMEIKTISRRRWFYIGLLFSCC